MTGPVEPLFLESMDELVAISLKTTTSMGEKCNVYRALDNFGYIVECLKRNIRFEGHNGTLILAIYCNMDHLDLNKLDCAVLAKASVFAILQVKQGASLTKDERIKFLEKSIFELCERNCIESLAEHYNRYAKKLRQEYKDDYHRLFKEQSQYYIKMSVDKRFEKQKTALLDMV